MRGLTLAGAAALALAACGTPPDPASDASASLIEYQGERLPVARACLEDNDASRLTPTQVTRIEAAMRAARVGPVFQNTQALSASLERLRFPCTGSFYANQLNPAAGEMLEIVYAEIPQRDLNRYIVAEQQPDGSLRVVDDFVAAAAPEITRVRRNAQGALEFQGQNGTVLTVVRR